MNIDTKYYRLVVETQHDPVILKAELTDLIEEIKNYNQDITTNEYQKYEYCKNINCEDLKLAGTIYFCDNKNCGRTAKEFHKWLKINNFKLVKE